MANITFFIGNGFDLQIGLNTKYTDFYNVYTSDSSNDNNLIRNFKESILKDELNGWITWADFESQMGKHSVNFANSKDFLECYNDFVTKFNAYLDEQCQQIDWVSFKQYQEFFDSLLKFWERINYTEHNRFADIVKCQRNQGGSISFLQFNYTNVFDKLLKEFKKLLTDNLNRNSAFEPTYGVRTVGQNLHIHGSLNKYPIIGVNNVEQIANDKIRDDKNATTVFVKQNFLTALQNRNVNVPIDANKALQVIQKSNIICTYGTSIGETDKYWWNLVGEWLIKNDRLLVIFDVCKYEDDGVSPLLFVSGQTNIERKREDIFNRFVAHTQWSAEDIKANKNKVIVEFNNNLFNFKIPKKLNTQKEQ